LIEQDAASLTEIIWRKVQFKQDVNYFDGNKIVVDLTEPGAASLTETRHLLV
jgi:hypothetical protein